MKTEEWESYANEQKRCGGLQKEEKIEKKTIYPAERPRIECTDSIPFDSSSGSFQLVISQ